MIQYTTLCGAFTHNNKLDFYPMEQTFKCKGVFLNGVYNYNGRQIKSIIMIVGVLIHNDKQQIKTKE